MGFSLGQAILDLAADGAGLVDDINKAKPKALGALSEMGKVGGMLLAAGITVAATAVIGISTVMWNSANTLDAAYDKIQTKTGAAGAQLEGLKADFEQVFTSVPTDADSAAEAVAGLNQRLGMTGPVLQETAGSLLEMTRLTGGDLSTNIELFTRFMGDAGIASEDASGALDALYVASQQTGTGVDRLMQLSVQFGAPMRQFGFSWQESAALLGKWEKEGVNTELVMGSLRIAAGKFASENVPLREGLEKTFDEIKNTEDGSKALALAMDVFGARAGPDMAAAIRENRFELGDLLPALENADGAIANSAEATADWGERLQLFKNRVTTAFAPAGQKLMDAATKVMDTFGKVLARPDIQQAIEEISTWIGNLAEDIAAAIPTMIDGFFEFVEWLKNNKPVIAGILAVLGAAFIAWAISAAVAAWAIMTPLLPLIALIALIGVAGYLLYRAWTENWGGIQEKMAAVWAWLQPILANIIAWFQVNIPIALQTLSAFWTGTLLPAIQAVGGWITGTLIPALTEIWNWLATNIPAAIAIVSEFWTNTLLPPMQAVWGWISGTLLPLFSALARLLGAVVGLAVKALAALWTNVLLPPLKTVENFIKANLLAAFNSLSEFVKTNITPVLDDLAAFLDGVLGPAMQSAGDTIGETIVAAFEWLSDTIQDVTEFIQDMIDLLLSIELPDWLTGGAGNGTEGAFGNGAAQGAGGMLEQALGQIGGLRIPNLGGSLGFAPPSLALARAGVGAGQQAGMNGQTVTFYAPVTFEVKDRKGFDELMRTLRS